MDFRSAALGSSNFKQEKLTIKIGEKDYNVIVKEVSLNDRDRILEKAQETVNKKGGMPDFKIHGNRMVVATVMFSTFDESGKRVFEDEDFESLMELPSETKFIDEIYEVSKKLNEVDIESLKKQ